MGMECMRIDIKLTLGSGASFSGVSGWSYYDRNKFLAAAAIVRAVGR